MTEKTASQILTLSARAIREARNLLAHQSGARGLRVGVRGGGCSGLTYFAEPAREERPGDRVLSFDGLDVFLDVKSQLFLAGTRLEWSDSLMQSGFVFHNPNAKRSCSCGESFTV